MKTSNLILTLFTGRVEQIKIVHPGDDLPEGLKKILSVKFPEIAMSSLTPIDKDVEIAFTYEYLNENLISL